MSSAISALLSPARGDRPELVLPGPHLHHARLRYLRPRVGQVLRYRPGVSPRSYHPRPNPSPLVVVSPSRAYKLWSMSEWLALTVSQSIGMGSPRYASQRHIPVAYPRCRARNRTAWEGGDMASREPQDEPRPDLSVNPIFVREPVRIPRNRLPAEELDPDAAYQIVHDELMLDANPRLNLATFVT